MQLDEIAELKKTIAGQKAQLNQTMEELRRLSEDRKKTRQYEQDFLLNMSHEMLPALNSIQILSSLLLENKEATLTPKQISYARIISDSGRDLQQLINDIQDLAQIMAGSFPMNFEQMSLKALATWLNRTFSKSCANKGLYLNIETAEGLPEKIVSDRNCVEKILKSLLSNAVKFTERGGIQVRLEKDEDFSGKEQISIAVSDTGTGIPEDKKEIIFKAFRAYARDVKHTITGTGLGLSMSRALAALLQGDIMLESREGEGSTFTLFLPLWNNQSKELKQESDSPAHKSASEAKKVSRIRDDRHDLSAAEPAMLIVEDDPNFARILFESTRENGFRCLLAEDGEAALQMATQFAPSGIILDLGLPRLDGLQVLARLKANPSTSAIPAYIISGFDRKYDAIVKGAVGYLSKPVNMARLSDAFDRIRRIMNKNNQKIVIWNHRPDGAARLPEILIERGYPSIVVNSLFELRETLTMDSGRCLLIDRAAGTDAIGSILDVLRESPSLHDIPVIIHGPVTEKASIDTSISNATEDLVILDIAQEEELAALLKRLIPPGSATTGAAEGDHESERRPGKELFPDKRILLLDHDDRNIFALSSILGEKAISISSAHSAREAEKLLESDGDFHMVMVDLHLADRNGLDVIRGLRKNERISTIPVIAMNSRGVTGDRQRCIEAGANEYLSKPILLEKLDAILQVWLNN